MAEKYPDVLIGIAVPPDANLGAIVQTQVENLMRCGQFERHHK
jgi:hypothetical protein